MQGHPSENPARLPTQPPRPNQDPTENSRPNAPRRPVPPPAAPRRVVHGSRPPDQTRAQRAAGPSPRNSVLSSPTGSPGQTPDPDQTTSTGGAVPVSSPANARNARCHHPPRRGAWCNPPDHLPSAPHLFSVGRASSPPLPLLLKGVSRLSGRPRASVPWFIPKGEPRKDGVGCPDPPSRFDMTTGTEHKADRNSVQRKAIAGTRLIGASPFKIGFDEPRASPAIHHKADHRVTTSPSPTPARASASLP